MGSLSRDRASGIPPWPSSSEWSKLEVKERKVLSTTMASDTLTKSGLGRLEELWRAKGGERCVDADIC